MKQVEQWYFVNNDIFAKCMAFNDDPSCLFFWEKKVTQVKFFQPMTDDRNTYTHHIHVFGGYLRGLKIEWQFTCEVFVVSKVPKEY